MVYYEILLFLLLLSYIHYFTNTSIYIGNNIDNSQKIIITFNSIVKDKL